MILDYIQDILLITLIIFQFAVMAYLLYTIRKKHKNDLKFWKKQNEISEEFLTQLRNQPLVSLENNKGDITIESENTDKK